MLQCIIACNTSNYFLINRSRVLLNLRNPGTFETVLRDLGEAVQLPNPRMIYTQKGNQVFIKELLPVMNRRHACRK